jgi:hypothetical protein
MTADWPTLSGQCRVEAANKIVEVARPNTLVPVALG